MPDFKDKCEFRDVIAIRKTPKALICLIDTADFVVPDSQIDDDSEVYQEGDEGTLIVSAWWARKEGIEP